MEAHPLREPTKVYTPFDGRETRILRRFVTQVEELAKCTFFEASGGQLRIAGGEEGMRTELPYAGEEALRAMLPIFRSLYLHNEPASARTVLRVLKQHAHARGGEHTDVAITTLKGWEQGLRQVVRTDPVIALTHEHQRADGTVEKRDLTPAYVIDLWLNGEYFHWDEAKAQELERYPMPDVLRFNFFTALMQLRNHYWGIANVVREILREPTLLDAVRRNPARSRA